MKGGWFVGRFDPTSFYSEEFEVGYKEFKKGEPHADHYHKVGTEINLIASGKVEFNGEVFDKGSVVIIEPGETTSTKFLEDSTIVVVKTPSLPDDKFLCED
jgi:quercetin dioxygenase-like cupin family protein